MGGRRRSERAVPALPAEHDVQPREHELQLLLRDAADTLREEGAVERDDLRDVGDGLLGEAGAPRRQENVAGRLGPFEVARERHAHDGRDAAPVEGVALDDENGPAEPRSGARRRGKVGPADVALGDHHSERSSTWRAAAEPNLSSLVSTSAASRSMASVIASGSWRATYSATAS